MPVNDGLRSAPATAARVELTLAYGRATSRSRSACCSGRTMARISSTGCRTVSARGRMRSPLRRMAANTQSQGMIEIPNGLSRGDRSRGDLDLDERVLTAPQLEQRHHVADRHLFGDQLGHQIGLVESDVDAHVAREQPRVIGVVHSRDDAAHTEFEAGDRRHDQVVLVVRRHRRHDVGLLDPGLH